jgi:hypothetical protein
VRDKEVDDEYLRLAKEKHVTQITGLVGHGAGFVYTERPAFLDDPGLSRLELLVKAGLTPLQAATINGARVLGMDQRFGSLQAGKAADFVVLFADPLADITNTRKIDAVWVGGRPVDRAALAK